MADSIRLAVLKWISTYLSDTVTTANGYTHTLTDKVFRGRSRMGEDDPLPMVSILEGMNPDPTPDVPDFKERPEQMDQWVVLFQGWTEDDVENPTDPAHQLLASLKQALALLNSRIQKREFTNEMAAVTWLQIEPGTVRPVSEASSRAFCWLRVVIGIAEPLADPFYTP